MIENERPLKPIIEYEINVNWHLKKLKKEIMTHYKCVNLEQNNFKLMCETQIEKILDSLKLLITHCQEDKEK